MYSVPERLGGFGLLVAAAAYAWPTLTARTGLGVPCPLRAVTGVPCPACGLTTAAVALVRGDVGGAVAANPLIVALAAVTGMALVLLGLRATGVLAPPRPWPAVRRRRLGWLLVPLATASWIYQLHRVGLA